MRGMKVLCARLNVQEQRIEVVREITKDDNSIEYDGLSLPLEKLAWISATYDIDDEDELVELAVYESFMEQERLFGSAQEARQHRRALLSTTKTRLGPMNPTDNVQTIRARLQSVGMDESYINAVGINPASVIKQHSLLSEADKQEKRERILAMREGRDLRKVPIHKSKLDEQRAKAKVDLPKANTLPTIKLSGGKRIG